MKCENCGAKIPKGSMYCKKCGKDVQLVPDYNYLEEDVLSNIIQEGVWKSAPKEVSDVSFEKAPKKRSNKRTIILVFVGILCIIGILTAVIADWIKKDIADKQANSYDYQFQAAEEYFNAEDYENALTYYGNALALKPNDSAVKDRMLEIYLLTGAKEEAISSLKLKINENEADIDAWQKLIDVYASDKEYDKIQELAETVKNMKILELFSDYLVGQPGFSQISGTYTNPLNIRISAGDDCEIYYTLDGSDPITDGELYRDAIPVKEGNIIISAVAKNKNGIFSEVVRAEYTVHYEPPQMPSVTPGGGTYMEGQLITINVPADCVAYYTWDGSEPTENSTLYTAPIEMPEGNQVLSVILVNSMGLKSRVNRINYIYMP